jgi:hypothetical protein
MEDIGVEVDRFEVTRRGMAHHSGAHRVGRSAGEEPEERRRLELELSMSSMGTRQSSWHGWLGRGMAGGAGSTVQCSHGWGRPDVSSALATSCGDGLVAGSSMPRHCLER